MSGLGSLAAPLLSLLALSAQDPVPLERWEALDLEAKWLLARDPIASGTKEEKEAWGAMLGARRELDLLEMLLICTPRDHAWIAAGKALVDAQAPHWVRAAVWTLRHPDSHVRDWARKALLEKRPGLVLAWLEAHPEAAEGSAKEVHEALLASAPPLEDASGLLPPLRVEEVLAHLDAPPDIEEFGDRLLGEPGRVYVHQVERAMEGMLAGGFLEEPWTGKHLALTRHVHPAVRQAAFLAMTRYPPARIPIDRAIEAAGDFAEAARVREAAVLALSYGLHPRAELRLHRISLDPEHPGWRAAVGRLGERGDGFTLERWRDLSPLSPEDARVLEEASARIRGREAAVDPARFANLLVPMLERAAWGEIEGDPLGPSAFSWTAGRIRAFAGALPVRIALGRLAESYAPRAEVFAPEEIDATRDRVRLLASQWVD